MDKTANSITYPKWQFREMSKHVNSDPDMTWT